MYEELKAFDKYGLYWYSEDPENIRTEANELIVSVYQDIYRYYLARDLFEIALLYYEGVTHQSNPVIRAAQELLYAKEQLEEGKYTFQRYEWLAFQITDRFRVMERRYLYNNIKKRDSIPYFRENYKIEINPDPLDLLHRWRGKRTQGVPRGSEVH